MTVRCYLRGIRAKVSATLLWSPCTSFVWNSTEDDNDQWDSTRCIAFPELHSRGGLGQVFNSAFKGLETHSALIMHLWEQKKKCSSGSSYGSNCALLNLRMIHYPWLQRALKTLSFKLCCIHDTKYSKPENANKILREKVRAGFSEINK